MPLCCGIRDTGAGAEPHAAFTAFGWSNSSHVIQQHSGGCSSGVCFTLGRVDTMHSGGRGSRASGRAASRRGAISSSSRRRVDTANCRSSDGNAAQPAGATAAAAALSVHEMVPWLVLCGRCLLLWAAELISTLALTSEVLIKVGGLSMSKQLKIVSDWGCSLDAAAAAAAADNSLNGSEGSAEEGFKLQDVQLDFDQELRAVFDLQLFCTVAVVLQARRDSGQFAADAYDTTKALTALQMAAVLAKEAAPLRKRAKSSAETCGSGSNDDDVSSVGDDLGYSKASLGQGLLVVKLQEAGRLLNVLPFGWGCNNPACRQFNKVSGLQLMKDKVRTCSWCGTVRYCIRECQTAHWKQHKGPYKAMAAAAANGTGAAQH